MRGGESRLAPKVGLWQLARDFGDLLAVYGLRGERQATFRGIETGLGKNRSASAGRFFLLRSEHSWELYAQIARLLFESLVEPYCDARIVSD